MISIVKFQVSKSKKTYLEGKCVYQYKRVSLNVPTKLFKIVDPYLKEQLQAYATSQNGILELKFTNRTNPKKR
jgi:hypothetical protein